MNCNDYNEAIAADPSESFDGGSAHVSSCESCSSYRGDMRALNDKIAQALLIEVPELKMPALPPIEADSNVVDMPFVRKTRITTPAWIGIAASFAIAAVFVARIVGSGTEYSSTEYSSLANEVVAHLDHEPNALRVVTTRVSTQTLNHVVSSDVADMGGVGLISYARTCTINGKQVPHLVIQGEKGPITLLLMPEEEVDSATPLQGEGIKGIIIPVGHGSIAIIGDRDEMLGEYQKRVIDSVRWST